MRRPTRTRRLSIAAIVSLLLFGAVAGAGIRSMWIQDYWHFGSFRVIGIAGGRVCYERLSGEFFAGERPLRYHDLSFRAYDLDSNMFSFFVHDGLVPSFGSSFQEFALFIPVWPLLLSLLFAPVRWLIARPASAPAFPVITDAKQKEGKTLQ